jgi:hypothetical protein
MLQPLFIYANYLPAATITASDTKSGTAAANLLEGSEDNSWQPANTSGSKTITIDLGIAQPIGAIAIAGEWLAGVSLEVRASTNNFSGSNVLISASAAMVEYLANYRSFTQASYRYWRLTISGHSTDTALYHLALSPGDLFPWSEEGTDPDSYQTTGSQLLSPDGRFLGATRQRTMRHINYRPGQISDAEYLLFAAWADSCIKNLQPFFYVADSSSTACAFVWCSPQQKFEAPYKKGLRDMTDIAMTGRVA